MGWLPFGAPTRRALIALLLQMLAACSERGANACVPTGNEVCGGGDEDCDGWVDDVDAPIAGRLTWYLDRDGDGHGNPGLPWLACVQPAGASADALDCDDGDPSVFGGAAETCDGRDEDCDGEIDDDAVDAGVWYVDQDGDGYGATTTGLAACIAPSGASATPGDCDDGDPTRSPGGAETCALGDEDCDGLEDDADPSLTGVSTWYPDEDGDGFGDEDAPRTGCTPEGADLGGDCDDTDPATNPLARDVCEDGVDQDCEAGDRACALLGAWALEDADVHFLSTLEGFGSSVAFAGDIDADGWEDVVFGALRSGGLRGALAAVRGPWSGDVDLDGEAMVWEGVAANDQAGAAVLAAGDLDADGLVDVFVGAPGVSPDQAGAAYLLSGALLSGPGVASLEDATAVVPGVYEWDAMGGALAACGDLTGTVGTTSSWARPSGACTQARSR